ncbi:MAG: NUDIX hydrolase [Thermodesulfobacteriota bacterium]
MTAERRISSGGVIFRPAGHKVEVALISTKGGKVWGLPKGLVEEGENIARTAHREVKEETGLDGVILGKIGHIEYFFTFKEDERLTRVFKIVYFFLMECTGGDVSDHDSEVEECRWFPIDEAIRLIKYEDEKGIIRKAKKMLREAEYF